MRDDVRREVELVLMQRSLQWALVGAFLSTLLPLLELFGEARPRILLIVTASTVIQWAMYVVRRRKYEAAVEEASTIDANEQPKGFLASRR